MKTLLQEKNLLLLLCFFSRCEEFCSVGITVYLSSHVTHTGYTDGRTAIEYEVRKQGITEIMPLLIIIYKYYIPQNK